MAQEASPFVFPTNSEVSWSDEMKIDSMNSARRHNKKGNHHPLLTKAFFLSGEVSKARSLHRVFRSVYSDVRGRMKFLERRLGPGQAVYQSPRLAHSPADQLHFSQIQANCKSLRSAPQHDYPICFIVDNTVPQMAEQFSKFGPVP